MLICLYLGAKAFVRLSIGKTTILEELPLTPRYELKPVPDCAKRHRKEKQKRAKKRQEHLHHHHHHHSSPEIKLRQRAPGKGYVKLGFPAG